MEAAQTTNHIGEHQEKKSSQSGSEVLIGGGRNFVGDQFRTREGSQTTTYIVKIKTKKQQEQVSRSEELNFFRKKVKSQKKKSSRSHVKVNTNQEKETDETIAVLVANLSLLALRLGGLGRRPFPPWLRLCCLYTKFLNKIFINIYSNNTLLNADKD